LLEISSIRAFCFVARAGTSQRLKIHAIALSWGKRGIDMANKPNAAGVKPDDEETYDEWFRRQVQEALVEADDPNTMWVSHEEVMRDWDEQRAALLAMIKAKQ
jgi:hypothetical protein